MLRYHRIGFSGLAVCLHLAGSIEIAASTNILTNNRRRNLGHFELGAMLVHCLSVHQNQKDDFSVSNRLDVLADPIEVLRKYHVAVGVFDLPQGLA